MLLSLLTIEDSESKWNKTLQDFCIENTASVPAITDREKEYFLPVLVHKMSEPNVSDNFLVTAFATIKIVTRSKTALDFLYEEKFLNIANTLLNTSTSSCSIVLEVLRILLNLCIINHERAIPIFKRSNLHTRLIAVNNQYGTEDRNITYVSLRLWFFFMLDHEAAKLLISEKKYDLYGVICDEMGTELVDTSKLQGKDNECNLHRQVLAEGYKVIFNGHMDTKLPKLPTVVRESQFKVFCHVFHTILTTGVYITQFNVTEITRIKDKLIGFTPIDENKIDITDPTMIFVESKDENGEWIPPIFAEDHDPDENKLNKCTLSKLKHEAIMILLYLFKEMETTFFEDLKAFKAFLHDFHRRLLLNPRRNEDAILPVLLIGEKIAKESNVGRLLLKNHIFQKRAFKAKKATAKAGMQPQDMTEEQERTANPYLLRTVLRKFLTCFREKIKVTAGEMLYHLCDDSADEFVRLNGFGNAIGHLKAKGLPGFNFVEKTVDLGELARELESEKKKGLTSEEAKEEVIRRLMNPIGNTETTPAPVITAPVVKEVDNEENGEKEEGKE